MHVPLNQYMDSFAASRKPVVAAPQGGTYKTSSTSRRDPTGRRSSSSDLVPEGSLQREEGSSFSSTTGWEEENVGVACSFRNDDTNEANKRHREMRSSQEKLFSTAPWPAQAAPFPPPPPPIPPEEFFLWYEMRQLEGRHGLPVRSSRTSASAGRSDEAAEGDTSHNNSFQYRLGWSARGSEREGMGQRTTSDKTPASRRESSCLLKERVSSRQGGEGGGWPRPADVALPSSFPLPPFSSIFLASGSAPAASPRPFLLPRDVDGQPDSLPVWPSDARRSPLPDCVTPEAATSEMTLKRHASSSGAQDVVTHERSDDATTCSGCEEMRHRCQHRAGNSFGDVEREERGVSPVRLRSPTGSGGKASQQHQEGPAFHHSALERRLKKKRKALQGMKSSGCRALIAEVRSLYSRLSYDYELLQRDPSLFHKMREQDAPENVAGSSDRTPPLRETASNTIPTQRDVQQDIVKRSRSAAFHISVRDQATQATPECSAGSASNASPTLRREGDGARLEGPPAARSAAARQHESLALTPPEAADGGGGEPTRELYDMLFHLEAQWNRLQQYRKTSTALRSGDAGERVTSAVGSFGGSTEREAVATLIRERRAARAQAH